MYFRVAVRPVAFSLAVVPGVVHFLVADKQAELSPEAITREALLLAAAVLREEYRSAERREVEGVAKAQWLARHSRLSYGHL